MRVDEGVEPRGHEDDAAVLLHPLDLSELIDIELNSLDAVSGQTFNVGGGQAGSVSLAEFTRLCQEATGREVAIAEDEVTNPVDVPWYVTDNARVTRALGWRPRRDPRQVVTDIASWIEANRQMLESVIT